jgi:hypothetical protein
MTGLPLSRSVRSTWGALALLAVLATACGERETPAPPPEAAPVVAPAPAESAGAPDTLVGDSVMARDTIPLPPP